MDADRSTTAWQRSQTVLLGLAGLVFLWAFWPVFADLADNWANSSLYSYCYVVPVFSAFLLWLRRDMIPAFPLKPSYAGIAFVALGAVLYLGATFLYFLWPARIAFIPVLVGAVLMVGGWPTLRWMWPSLFFLIFAIPLPGFAENNVLRPLQRIATLASTNVLQTIGIFAQADGNVILLREHEMGVVEACSGLSMLAAFVAMAVALTFFLERPLWQKLVIIASAFPIAVACNVVRISITGVLYEYTSPAIAELVFHNNYAAPWLMMALAMLMLAAVLKLLDALLVVTPATQPAHPLIPVT